MYRHPIKNMQTLKEFINSISSSTIIWSLLFFLGLSAIQFDLLMSEVAHDGGGFIGFPIPYYSAHGWYECSKLPFLFFDIAVFIVLIQYMKQIKTMTLKLKLSIPLIVLIVVALAILMFVEYPEKCSNSAEREINNMLEANAKCLTWMTSACTEKNASTFSHPSIKDCICTCSGVLSNTACQEYIS